MYHIQTMPSQSVNSAKYIQLSIVSYRLKQYVYCNQRSSSSDPGAINKCHVIFFIYTFNFGKHCYTMEIMTNLQWTTASPLTAENCLRNVWQKWIMASKSSGTSWSGQSLKWRWVIVRLVSSWKSLENFVKRVNYFLIQAWLNNCLLFAVLMCVAYKFGSPIRSCI